MREIKFRAWHIDEGIFDYTPVIASNGEIYKVVSGELVAKYLNSVLEQYIGLKDKNGKEIYEGDVIKSGKKNYSTNPVSYDEQLYLIQPDFIFNCGCCGYVYGYDVPSRLENEECEVVGNIHENPELLDKCL